MTRLLRILDKREPFRAQAVEVNAGANWLHRWAHGLSVDNGMTTVAERLAYLEQVFQEFPAQLSWMFLPKWRGHFLDQWTKWKAGLLVCYDVPLLPNTNNDLEGFFRRLKCHFRKITGREAWDSYIQRYGKEAAFFYGSPQFVWEDVINLPWNQFLIHRASREKKQEILSAMRRFRKDPPKYLAKLEETWGRDIDVS